VEADLTLRPWTVTQELSDPHDLADEIEENRYEALFVEADFVLEETFAAAPTLRFVGVCRGDHGHVDVDAAEARGVTVVYTPRRNANAVAELTVLLMLNLLRPVREASAFVTAGLWTDPVAGYTEFRGVELSSQTVGIIGLGAIGARTAALLQPFGCPVLVTDPALLNAEVKALGCTPVPLAELLTNATLLAVHCPATPETHGLIDAEALAKLPHGARLVATTGGGVVDADAVAAALCSGRLAGAALDVFETHPLLPDHPLVKAPNALLLPHIGGATDATVVRYSDMIVTDWLRFLAGKTPLHLATSGV
jgi:D-3-phosphoglycerate dehydrogenase